MSKRTKPPFRADHVGSLLRPAALKEAREKRASGEIDADALKSVEDREIERVVKKQEEIGLEAVTDGVVEYRMEKFVWKSNRNDCLPWLSQLATLFWLFLLPHRIF